VEFDQVALHKKKGLQFAPQPPILAF
jgi:hypothetical protein